MKTGYSLAQKALHWTSVALIVDLWWSSRAVLRTHEIHAIGQHVNPSDVFQHRMHIYGGILLLGLVGARLFLRWRSGVPPLPASVPHWSAATAKLAYGLIYTTLIGLTLTGLVTSYLWFGMSTAHRLLVYAMYAFVVAHVAAVVWHDVAHRARLLARMWGG